MSVDLPEWPWPWPWPGGEDPTPPEPVTNYVRFADGTLSQIVAAGIDPVVPDGAELVTQEEYEGLRAAMQDAHEARIAAAVAAEEGAARQQFTDLVAAGIPETTARALARYDGPAQGA